MSSLHTVPSVQTRLAPNCPLPNAMLGAHAQVASLETVMSEFAYAAPVLQTVAGVQTSAAPVWPLEK